MLPCVVCNRQLNKSLYSLQTIPRVDRTERGLMWPTLTVCRTDPASEMPYRQRAREDAGTGVRVRDRTVMSSFWPKSWAALATNQA